MLFPKPLPLAHSGINMKHFLLDWSWLVCLLVGVELPILFLEENIRASPSYRMWALLGKERLVERAAGAVWFSVFAVLLLLLIFAGWKAALFVMVSNILALAADNVLAAAVGLINHPAYSFIVGPALWGITFLVLLITRLSH